MSNSKAPGQAAFEAFVSVMSPEATWETRSMKERGAWARAEVAAQDAPQKSSMQAVIDVEDARGFGIPTEPLGAPKKHEGNK